MTEKFEQLASEKKARILNAALAVFAEQGFAQASTNEITRRAAISKGLLFHYFGTKEALFLYLIDHCIAVIREQMPPLTDLKGRDMLESIREQSLLKLKIITRYPQLFAFYQVALSVSEPGLKEQVLQKQAQFVRPMHQELYELFDYSAFRPDLDRKKTYTVIMGTLEKVGLDAFEHEQCSMQEIVRRINEYVDYFKQLFYRKDLPS